MKFMFFSEAETLPGASYQTRYWELVEQVIHAEKWGFDCFGVSEQQYAIGGAIHDSANRINGGTLNSKPRRRSACRYASKRLCCSRSGRPRQSFCSK